MYDCVLDNLTNGPPNFRDGLNPSIYRPGNRQAGFGLFALDI
jgi:hypothetical protein